MFHDTDEARINIPPRNTNHLAFNTPNHHDFVEMVWENNTLVMQQQQKSNRLCRGSSSGFTDFFENITRFESGNVNPRAVPDESDNYGLLPINVNTRSSNKRSADEQVPAFNKKKLKAIMVDQSNEFIITPQADSLVPGAMEHTRKMIESNDHLVPGPDMSIAASNDTIYQDSDSSEYIESQQWSDEYEDEESAARRRRCWNYRRNRSPRSEKKRRDRINKKMRALQVLLPNSNTVVDKASVLDEAIEYVKSLQLQLQLMSSGTHMFAPPMMMPQIPMNQFSAAAAAAAAAAMGLGMAPHQFPISPMHGFPQIMSCFPYMPFFGGPSLTSSPMAVPVVQADETASVDQIGSTPPPPMSGSNQSSYPNDFFPDGVRIGTEK